MKVAVHQPNYFPWLGYFAKMSRADLFIFLDDVKLSKGSYVNRTKIHAKDGGAWLTVPIHRDDHTPIKDVRFAKADWRGHHRKTLVQTYRKAPFFEPVMALLDDAFALDCDGLCDVNIGAITRIAEALGVSCRFERSSAFGLTSSSDDRLVELVKAVGGDTYLSGAGGNKYQDPEKFERAGIELCVCEYRPRPYRQFQGGGFVPGLSVLDAMFNLGPEAVRHLSYGDAETFPLPA